MMLSRLIPRPVFCFTKMPSSSGPRCTMVWHMPWTTASSIRCARSELTIPAMPHMVIPLPRLCCRLEQHARGLFATIYSGNHDSRRDYPRVHHRQPKLCSPFLVPKQNAGFLCALAHPQSVVQGIAASALEGRYLSWSVPCHAYEA